MARLQILELPEGDGDERPPFVLVIDQASESTINALETSGDSLYAAALGKLSGPSVAEQIGARAVLVFEETIDIPANDTLPSGTQWELTVDGRPATWTPAKS